MTTTLTSLYSIVQGKNESLRQYMARFSMTSLHIFDLHPIVAMHMFLVGLHPRKFIDSFYVNIPADMD